MRNYWYKQCALHNQAAYLAPAGFSRGEGGLLRGTLEQEMNPD